MSARMGQELNSFSELPAARDINDILCFWIDEVRAAYVVVIVVDGHRFE